MDRVLLPYGGSVGGKCYPVPGACASIRWQVMNCFLIILLFLFSFLSQMAHVVPMRQCAPGWISSPTRPPPMRTPKMLLTTSHPPTAVVISLLVLRYCTVPLPTIGHVELPTFTTTTEFPVSTKRPVASRTGTCLFPFPLLGSPVNPPSVSPDQSCANWTALSSLSQENVSSLEFEGY